MRALFRQIAQNTAHVIGSPWAFAAAVAIVALWAFAGPVFAFSDTWQLFINTGTTIVTFLVVFLIQNTQNRDTRAIQLKLDELLRAVEGAHTRLVGLEEMTDEELDALHERFQRLGMAHVRAHDGATENGVRADLESVLDEETDDHREGQAQRSEAGAKAG